MANVFNFGIGLTVADEATAKIDKAFTGYAQQAQSLASTFSDISEKLNLSQFINEDAFTLADATAKITAQMGLMDSATTGMQTSIVEMSALTGRSVETFTKLTQALSEAGLRLDDFTSATTVAATEGQAAQTVWGEREALAGLIDAYDVAAEEAAQFAKGSKLLNVDLKGSLDRMTQLQQTVPGVTGLVAQMPHVIQGAREALVEFGEEITGNGPQMVEAISKTGAAFAKALGRTAAEAVRSAVASFQKFSGELDNNRRLLVGLSSSVSPATDALFELGLGFDEANDLLRQGQENPVQFAARIREMTDAMKASGPGGALQAQRAILKLTETMQNTPIPELLRNNEAFNKSMEAMAYANSAAGVATGKFQETVEKMWNTGRVAVDVFNNLVKLGKVVVGLFGEDILKDVFSSINKSLGSVNKRIQEFTRYISENEDYQKRIRPKIVMVGKAMLAVSTAAGAAASAFGVLASGAFAVSGLSKAVNLLLQPMKKLTGMTGGKDLLKFPKFFTSMSNSIGKLVGKAGKLFLPVTIITSVVDTLRELGNTMGDPKMLSGDKFVSIMKGVAQTAADVFDKLLFGIPSMLTKTFFPEVQGGFRKGVGQIMESLIGGFRGLSLRDVARSLTEQFLEIGDSIATSLVTSISNFFSSGDAEIAFIDFVLGIKNLFWGLVDVTKDVASGIMEAFLARFGSSLVGVGAMFENTWIYMKIGAYQTIHGITNQWAGFTDWLGGKFAEVRAGFTIMTVDLGLMWDNFITNSQEAFATFGTKVSMTFAAVAHAAIDSVFSIVQAIFTHYAKLAGKLAAVAGKLGLTSIQNKMLGVAGSLANVSQKAAQFRDQESERFKERSKELATQLAAEQAPFEARRKLMAQGAELAKKDAAEQVMATKARYAEEAALRENAQAAKIGALQQEIDANNKLAATAADELKAKIAQEKTQKNLAKTAETRRKEEEKAADATKKGNKTLAEKCRELEKRRELARKFAGSTNFMTQSGAASIGAFGSPAKVVQTSPTSPRPVPRATTTPQPAKTSPARKDAKAAAARVQNPKTEASLSKDAERAIIAAAEAGGGAEVIVKLMLDKGLLEKYTRARNARVIARTGLG